MDGASFGALFDSFTHTAFRLETLQSYAVAAEDDEFRAWREGRPLPEYSVRTSEWLARIATSTLAEGKRWSRVHLIQHPLSEYLQWEIAGYVEQQAVGESIQLVDLNEHPAVGGCPDFWLFDEDTDHAQAVLMHYDDDGALIQRELTANPWTIGSLRATKLALIEVAVPLNTYLAGRRVA